MAGPGRMGTGAGAGAAGGRVPQAAAGPAAVRDLPAERRVVGPRRVLARGRVQAFVAEDVDLGGGRVVKREFAAHPGAVAVIALDSRGRVLLQRQYRHPVGFELWEPPAGLLDVEGEEPLAAARRELAEEADLLAGDWRRLADFFTTPGGCDERIRIYLARDLAPVPAAERFAR
ncbi:MAG: NUDIX hydrolase, partial [Bifidobacteriaceae bacterium]|nr:NUDIX hydrolase [Bifidobacteriaceae bacterium]